MTLNTRFRNRVVNYVFLTTLFWFYLNPILKCQNLNIDKAKEKIALANKFNIESIDSAITIYKSVLDSFKFENEELKLEWLLDYSNLLYQNGDYEIFGSITEEVLKNKVLPSLPNYHSIAYGNLGAYFRFKRQFFDCHKANLFSLKLLKSTTDIDSIDLAISYINLGSSSLNSNQGYQGIDFLNKAISILTNLTLSDKNLVHESNLIKAKIYLELKKPEKAKTIYSELFSEIPASSKNKRNLRILQFAIFRFLELENNFIRKNQKRSLIRKLEDITSKVKQNYYFVDISKAREFLSKKDTTKALILYRKALNTWELHNESLKVSQQKYDILNELYTHLITDNLEDINELIESTKLVDNNKEYIILNIPFIESTLRKIKYLVNSKKAEHSINENLLQIDSIRNVLRKNSVIKKVKTNNILEERVITKSIIEILYPLKNNFHPTLFKYINANKSSILDEASLVKQKLEQFNIPDSIKQQYFELQSDVAFYNTKVLEEKAKYEPNTKKLDKLELTLLDKKTRYENLVRSYNITELLGNSEYTIEDVQNQLRDDEVLIEYFTGDYNYLFAIDKDSHEFIRLDTTQNIDALVTRLRNELSNPPSDDYESNFMNYTSSAFDLYNYVLAPLEMNIDNKKLIVIPDGSLNTIPFETLIKETPSSAVDYSTNNLSYLFEDHSISYAYNLSSIFVHRDKAIDTQGDFLGIAPSFSGTEDLTVRSCNENELSKLYCAGEEINELQNIFGGITYTEGEATMDKLFQNNHSIVHLATHACVDYDNPELSKIFFTDEYLSSHDLIDRNLKTDLTVLSACGTGSGQYQEGDGIATIAKDFMYAGSRSLVTSLWNVDDCTTKDLMVHFYNNLKDGLAKNDALKEAKKSMLNESETVFTHPFYWGSFVLVGDNEVLQSMESGWKYYYFLLGTILFIGLIFLVRRFK